MLFSHCRNVLLAFTRYFLKFSFEVIAICEDGVEGEFLLVESDFVPFDIVFEFGTSVFEREEIMVRSELGFESGGNFEGGQGVDWSWLLSLFDLIVLWGVLQKRILGVPG